MSEGHDDKVHREIEQVSNHESPTMDLPTTSFLHEEQTHFFPLPSPLEYQAQQILQQASTTNVGDIKSNYTLGWPVPPPAWSAVEHEVQEHYSSLHGNIQANLPDTTWTPSPFTSQENPQAANEQLALMSHPGLTQIEDTAWFLTDLPLAPQRQQMGTNIEELTGWYLPDQSLNLYCQEMDTGTEANTVLFSPREVVYDQNEAHSQVQVQSAVQVEYGGESVFPWVPSNVDENGLHFWGDGMNVSMRDYMDIAVDPWLLGGGVASMI